jgi:hypothetical protein
MAVYFASNMPLTELTSTVIRSKSFSEALHYEGFRLLALIDQTLKEKEFQTMPKEFVIGVIARSR